MFKNYCANSVDCEVDPKLPVYYKQFENIISAAAKNIDRKNFM